MTKKKDDDMDGIIFFGAADRKSDRDGELDPEGKITSEYPAFYFKSKIDELKDEIKTDEAHLARNKRFRIFDSEQVATQQEALQAKRERLELIESSKPKMTSRQKDLYYNEYNRLGKEIREGLFTVSEMKMGTVSAHEEADRMTEISQIKVSPEVARALNLKTDRSGRVSRTQAEKAWKILGATFGEETNVESLRRDRVTARTFRRG